MKILVSLSDRMRRVRPKSKVDELSTKRQKAKNGLSRAKKDLKAAQGGIKLSEKHMKSKNPDTVAKYKKINRDMKTRVRMYESTIKKATSEIAKLTKAIDKEKAK